MISQETAIALSRLYGSYFGRIYNSRFIQSRASNNRLADFLYKLGLPDTFRRDALSEVSPNQVTEFILKFCASDVLDESEEELTPEEREELTDKLPLLLAEAILNEVAPHLSSADDSFRERVSSLLRCLDEEGYYFYKSGLLTNKQLVDTFGVFYNPETKVYVEML